VNGLLSLAAKQINQTFVSEALKTLSHSRMP